MEMAPHLFFEIFVEQTPELQTFNYTYIIEILKITIAVTKALSFGKQMQNLPTRT